MCSVFLHQSPSPRSLIIVVFFFPRDREETFPAFILQPPMHSNPQQPENFFPIVIVRLDIRRIDPLLQKGHSCSGGCKRALYSFMVEDGKRGWGDDGGKPVSMPLEK